MCKVGHYIGPSYSDGNRTLNSELPNHLNSWRIETFPKNSEIIPRIWLGVPEKICKDYVNKSTHREYHSHSYVTGYADPTNSIPPGCISVIGISHLTREYFLLQYLHFSF